LIFLHEKVRIGISNLTAKTIVFLNVAIDLEIRLFP